MIFKNQGLTATQVEALQECFDFVRNGYLEIISYSSKEFWFVKLKHKTNRKVLLIFIYDDFYYIKNSSKLVKLVENKDDGSRYDIVVDSQMNIKKKKVCLGERRNLIFGSDLPNSDEA